MDRYKSCKLLFRFFNLGAQTKSSDMLDIQLNPIKSLLITSLRGSSVI